MLACLAMRLRIAPFAVALTTFAALASACGGSDSPTPGPIDLTYGISGTVRGLTGKGLVVQLNGADPVFVSAGTGTSPVTFAFAKKLVTGTVYEVKVANQPTGPDQVCTVTNGNGTIRDRNIADVDITCAQSAAPVSGTASGIENGTVAVITLNGANDLALTPGVGGYPNWAFATPVAFGAPYTVAVKTAPAGKACGVENGTGTIAGPVTNVAVTCGYAVGGTILGLPAGQTVTLANGTDELPLTAASVGFPKFKFNRPIDAGKPYAVTVKTQPGGARRCVVRNGTGTIAAASVDNVEVDCRCNPTALLLGAGTAFEAAFNAAVQADGFTVTAVPNFVSYAGQPDAAGFGTTVAFLNPNNATMPDAGQQSILAAAAAGSGFVVNGWAHYRTQALNTDIALRNLYLFNARYTEVGNVNLTVAATTPNHPLLNGIVLPFVMTASPYYMPAQPPVAGSTVVATEQNYGRPLVAVRESVAAEGRRVNFTIDPFYGADRITADPKLLRLYLNAIKWSAHCE